ncbi:hypothetical protein RRG08_046443 [Elysia crispata]|uniref:Uncharacterized protein n=1 Tax=Elysia crispata TaxID=231223 RepID=A0AAE0YIA5_9GAST|nr:hypothetical protein RRG08_046443 [Elysia crispata]
MYTAPDLPPVLKFVAISMYPKTFKLWSVAGSRYELLEIVLRCLYRGNHKYHCRFHGPADNVYRSADVQQKGARVIQVLQRIVPKQHERSKCCSVSYSNSTRDPSVAVHRTQTAREILVLQRIVLKQHERSKCCSVSYSNSTRDPSVAAYRTQTAREILVLQRIVLKQHERS